MTTATERVITAFGGEGRGCKNKTAEILGTSPQVISHWLRTGIIPARWQSVILEKAKQLKVKIKPQDLIAA